MMKKLILLTLILITCAQALLAQKGKASPEGTTYYLPRTELRFAIQVEKTTYTPGEFAMYAEKYMRLTDVGMSPTVTYRIIGVSLTTEGERDTSKTYVAPTDGKHNIQSLKIDENGVLLAINAEPRSVKQPEPFVPAARPAALNPRDYMSEEILSAGSSAKMAELCAAEIYDIRESKSLLNKGQADFMPKDGDQLRVMLRNLNTQEEGLYQLFRGVTVRDTMETIVKFVPEKTADRQILFRFSKWTGFTDIDDLGGSPYYIGVEDKHLMPSIQENMLSIKPAKDNGGVYVNLPGKVKVTLYRGEERWTAYELYAAQYGRVEQLSDELFGKKLFTSLVLNPVTGSVESLQSETVKK